MARAKKKMAKAKNTKAKVLKPKADLKVKAKKVKKPKVKRNPVEYNTWKEVSYSKHLFVSGDTALADTVEYIEVEGGRIYRNSLEATGRLKRWLVFVPDKK